ncbi:MAG: Gfo/Idh/MocA family oxidoreductase [Anaerolineales bacterium]|nr:Gfo/Idh/MocA family oxidoreductase [Anaerolineales bacterium]
MTASVSQPLAVGLIGAGGMGTRHAVNLHRFVPGARVAAVYDLDADRAAHAAAQSGGGPVCDDPLQLIQDPAVDAVLIASPDDTHARLTLACLAAGKPVLCEKPLATGVADAAAVVEAEAALGRRLISVGFMRRFDAEHVAVRSAAHSGAIGAPLLFKGVHRNATAAFGVTGATILINSAGHDLDSARWMLSAEVAEVRVRGLRSRADLHADTRDLLAVELAFAGGALAVIEVFVNAGYGYEVTAELVCQSGTAVSQQPDRALVRAQGQRGFPVPSDWLSRFQEAYVIELTEWVASIREGRAFTGASAWDGLAAMTVTNACIQALTSGAVTPVQLPQRPGLYEPVNNAAAP